MSHMSKDTPNNIQIELHVPDFATVRSFYGDTLGFMPVWERTEGNSGDYLVMEREGTIISFWPGNETVTQQSYFNRFPANTKRGFGVEIVIPVKNVREFHDNIKDTVNIVNPLVKRPWGLWDFRIEDPFGFYLRITEHHDIKDTKYSVSTDFSD